MNRKPSSRPAQPIASVGNALTLLGMFGDRDRIRISEASEALGVSPSTASRLMSMLQRHDFVRQDDESRAYVSGPKLIEIALGAQRRFDRRLHLRPHLERLAAEVGESAHFAILSGAEIVFTEGVESSKPVRSTLRIGVRRPAQCISAGKAILAAMDEREVRKLFPRERLPTCNERSLATRTALLAELERARALGYATSIGESEIDVAAVAVPLLDARDRVLGAICVSMPISRFRADDLEWLLPSLRAAAEEAGRYVP